MCNLLTELRPSSIRKFLYAHHGGLYNYLSSGLSWHNSKLALAEMPGVTVVVCHLNDCGCTRILNSVSCTGCKFSHCNHTCPTGAFTLRTCCVFSMLLIQKFWSIDLRLIWRKPDDRCPAAGDYHWVIRRRSCTRTWSRSIRECGGNCRACTIEFAIGHWAHHWDRHWDRHWVS